MPRCPCLSRPAGIASSRRLLPRTTGTRGGSGPPLVGLCHVAVPDHSVRECGCQDTWQLRTTPRRAVRRSSRQVRTPTPGGPARLRGGSGPPPLDPGALPHRDTWRHRTSSGEQVRGLWSALEGAQSVSPLRHVAPPDPSSMRGQVRGRRSANVGPDPWGPVTLVLVSILDNH